MGDIAISPDAIVRAIAFAIEQRIDVDVVISSFDPSRRIDAAMSPLGKTAALRPMAVFRLPRPIADRQ